VIDRFLFADTACIEKEKGKGEKLSVPGQKDSLKKKVDFCKQKDNQKQDRRNEREEGERGGSDKIGKK